MFSKSLLQRLGLIATLLMAAGCFQTKEPVDSSPIPLGGDQYKCLSRASDTFEDYFSGLASADEVNKTWDCLSLSLRLFADHAHGKRPGVYTSKALQKFLNHYFLEDGTLTDELMKEAMALKVAILGGSESELTLAELDRTQQLIQVLASISSRMLPYMPLSPRGVRTRSEASVDAAIEALNSSMRELGNSLQLTAQDYAFVRMDKLVSLLIELNQQRQKRTAHLEGFRRRIPMIRKSKLILLGTSTEKISGNEWTQSLITAANWFALRLKVAHLDGGYATWETDPGLKRFVSVWDEFEGLMQAAFEKNPGKKVPLSELEDLAMSFHPEDTEPIRPTSLKGYVRPMIQKVLAQGSSAQHLTASALLPLKNSIYRWHTGQRVLISLFKDARDRGLFPGDDILGFTKSGLLASFDLMPIGPGERLERDTLSFLLQQHWTRPLFIGNDRTMSFLPASQQKHFSFHALSELNWMNQAAEFLISAYEPSNSMLKADDQLDEREAAYRGCFFTGAFGESRPCAVVRERELKEFYDDLYDIGIDLKLFDPAQRQFNPSQQRFREANLFTYAANGDSFMSVPEGAQLLAFLVSGRRMEDNIHLDILERCKDSLSLIRDLRGFFTIKKKCYLDTIFGQFADAKYFSKMQNLVAYYQGLQRAPEKLSAFKEAFEKAVRGDIRADDFDSRDSERFAMIAQYMEQIYQRFDENGDSFIDNTEGELAFDEVYKQTVEKLVEKYKLPFFTPDAREVFLFFLEYGRVPGKLEYFSWVNGKKKRKPIYSNRTTILNLFSSLAKEISQLSAKK